MSHRDHGRWLTEQILESIHRQNELTRYRLRTVTTSNLEEQWKLETFDQNEVCTVRAAGEDQCGKEPVRIAMLSDGCIELSCIHHWDYYEQLRKMYPKLKLVCTRGHAETVVTVLWVKPFRTP